MSKDVKNTAKGKNTKAKAVRKGPSSKAIRRITTGTTKAVKELEKVPATKTITADAVYGIKQVRSLVGTKPVGKLSGGEQSRLRLARLMLRAPQVLILDEPTNHLDMRAKAILLDALRHYTGTVVFVSHDRYFVDGLANRVFEVAEGKVETYTGNYEDFLRQKQGAANEDELETEPEALPAIGVPPSKPEPKPKRINPIRLRQMRERAEEIEDDVARQEAGIAECERSLTVFRSAEETKQLTALLEERRRELDALLNEWEELTTAISENSD